MFLDDKLIDKCSNLVSQKAFKVDAEDIQQVYNELFNECCSYIASRVDKTNSKQEIKALIDRTFKLWDSFVEKAMVHSNPRVVLLGNICKKIIFKDKYLSDNIINKVYKNLCL